jgi:hypothetical protein
LVSEKQTTNIGCYQLTDFLRPILRSVEPFETRLSVFLSSLIPSRGEGKAVHFIHMEEYMKEMDATFRMAPLIDSVIEDIPEEDDITGW